VRSIPRASLLTRWHARRLSERVRAELQRAPVADDGDGALRTIVVGVDPIRVLLFGSGPLVGYGVRTRREAVDGPLGELLADRTRRGVVVESRVRLQLPVREAVPSLGGAGTATFAVAVWAPRFGDELQHADVEHYRAELHEMLQEFRRESDIPLILCQLPKPLGLDWRSTLRRPRIAALNGVLVDAASIFPDVHTVDGGTYRPAEGTTDAQWHRSLAERLVPIVVQALGVRTRV
jgi:hypothetical protein